MDSLAALPLYPRRRYLLAATLLSVVIIAYYLPQAMRGRSLGEGEGVTYYLPMRELVADAWRSGHWPVWNPYTYGGMPLLADCQAGAFYPPNLLYLWLEPVVAMNVIILSGQVIAAWGMIFLLRAYRVSPGSAAAGAMAFVFSGFMIAHMGHVTIVNAATWLPWLCLATHCWLTAGGRGWLIVGGLLWSVQLAAGHPQIVVYCGIIVGMQVIALFMRGEARSLPSVFGLTLMAALAIAICAVQLWPTLDFSRHTGRTFHASLALFQNYRFAIEYTPLLWLPFLFGTQTQAPLDWYFWGDWNFVEQAGYVGLLPWMLLPAAVALPGGRARPGRSWAIIGGLHLILAWNTDTPIGRLLFHVPIYNSFESAGRHLLGLILALSICTGIALDALAETSRLRARRWSRRGAWAIGVIVLTIVAGGIWGYEYATVHLHHDLGMTDGRPGLTARPWMKAPWAFIAPPVIAALSAWALMRFSDRRNRLRYALLIAVLLADVLSAGYLCAWRWRHDDKYRIKPPSAELKHLLSPRQPNAPPPRYLLFGPWGYEYALNAQGNMGYRLASLNGYGPFQLQRFKAMVGNMNHDGMVTDDSLLETSRALDLWSCRYVIVRHWPGDRPPEVLADASRYRLAATVGGLEVYENRSALPHAWFVDEVLQYPRCEEVLEAIVTGQFDPSRSALTAIDEDGTGLMDWQPSTTPVPATGDRSIRWLAYECDHLRIEASTPRGAVLVLAEPFFDGWHAYLDGGKQPVPIARVDYMLRGVWVPAGTHTLEMGYEPAALRHGAMVSLAGIAGLVIIAVWPWRRHTANPTCE